MRKLPKSPEISRCNFVKVLTGGVMATAVNPLANIVQAKENLSNDIFHVSDLPDNPFFDKKNKNYHSGVEMLLK